tara:strand:- start:268 stop:669 length:402 start_codon:yes stop_codon:yes gene_type:complete
MDLKTICLQNIVNQIKQMPPLLQEELIGYSLKTIKEQAKKEAKKEFLDELKRDSRIVINDLTDRIVECRRTGIYWTRPQYTQDIDDSIYYNFVDISEMIVNKYSQEIIFRNSVGPFPIEQTQDTFFEFSDDEY